MRGAVGQSKNDDRCYFCLMHPDIGTAVPQHMNQSHQIASKATFASSKSPRMAVLTGCSLILDSSVAATFASDRSCSGSLHKPACAFADALKFLSELIGVRLGAETGGGTGIERETGRGTETEITGIAETETGIIGTAGIETGAPICLPFGEESVMFVTRPSLSSSQARSRTPFKLLDALVERVAERWKHWRSITSITAQAQR